MDQKRSRRHPDEREDYKRDQIRREAGLKAEEEYAAEIAPAPVSGDATDRKEAAERKQEGQQEIAGGRTIGWIALAFAIAALFMYPAALGCGAIVLGIIAYVQGSRALGGWSVVIGGIALISYLVLVPYYA
jgi:hypothetical protein